MDRSYLSRPEVIAASRKFVCIRLTTYEDEAENAFLKTLFVGRSGEVENTTFTLLTPDGKTPLSRVHRSARQVFADSAEMAAAMNRVAAKYADRPAVTAAGPTLPTVRTVRLALNVAAGDNLPLVVLYAKDAAGAKALAETVRPVAWEDRFLGRFVFAVCTDAKDLKAIEGAAEPGVLVIQPDTFGQKGEVLTRITPDATAKALADGLAAGAEAFRKAEKSFSTHVRQGRSAGVFWDTKLPVSDPQEAQARERNRPKK
jgi:hypothetical protein